MPWNGYNHLSMQKPATASAECKKDVGEPKNYIVLGGSRISSCGRCMTNNAGNVPDPQHKRRYTWPWFVLAAVLLAIVLAVLWMSKEVERTRRFRELNAPASRSDRSATSLVASRPGVDWRL
jgi:hypothetical protein